MLHRLPRSWFLLGFSFNNPVTQVGMTKSASLSILRKHKVLRSPAAASFGRPGRAMSGRPHPLRSGWGCAWSKLDLFPLSKPLLFVLNEPDPGPLWITQMWKWGAEPHGHCQEGHGSCWAGLRGGDPFLGPCTPPPRLHLQPLPSLRCRHVFVEQNQILVKKKKEQGPGDLCFFLVSLPLASFRCLGKVTNLPGFKLFVACWQNERIINVVAKGATGFSFCNCRHSLPAPGSVGGGLTLSYQDLFTSLIAVHSHISKSKAAPTAIPFHR